VARRGAGLTQRADTAEARRNTNEVASTRPSKPKTATGQTFAGPLVRYEAACRALAEARSVDEVKDVRDKATAMAAYARQARNRDLEVDAIEIRLRATRRLDQLRQAQKATIELNEGGRPRKTGVSDTPVVPTLASIRAVGREQTTIRSRGGER
jgi:hypothetical protein